MKTKIITIVCLFTTAIIWGFAFVAQFFGANEVGPFAMNGLRFPLGTLSLLPVMLIFEKKKMDEFLNVMAINLRMLLCDRENSLLPKMLENPLFHRGRFSYEDNVIHPDSLFSLEEKVSLPEFLSQVVIRRDGSRSVTVGKIIKAAANKCGGAHLDTELSEDFYLASSVSKYYFIVMAMYVIKMAGFDYNAIIEEFLNTIK